MSDPLTKKNHLCDKCGKTRTTTSFTGLDICASCLRSALRAIEEAEGQHELANPPFATGDRFSWRGRPGTIGDVVHRIDGWVASIDFDDGGWMGGAKRVYLEPVTAEKPKP